ncbi:MAG TPA: polysaccharide biosynthesis tyrosine autokinase [Anaeromyxobacteraceae bacterium]|nr:polysaccharide biosynthesis tyrosine autokinase [Anaeromyxobacteraceae bacterium]
MIEKSHISPVPTPPRVQPVALERGNQGYLPALLESKWWILATTAVGLIVGLFYAVTAPPIYQSDVLVQLEETEHSSSSASEDLASLLTPKSQAETEMEILRSRSLLGSVSDELGLDVTAEPRHVQFIGAFLARRWSGTQPAPPVLGLSHYAWGGERIQIEHLHVPRALEGVPLVLIAGNGTSYQLADSEGKVLLKGKVGRTAMLQPPSSPDETPEEPLEILVRTLRARPGTEFVVSRRPRTQVIAELQGGLEILERGKTKTGVLQISLSGGDPRTVARTVDAVAENYLRMNVERRSAEAERKLEFLNTQLPVLKANLDKAEAALNTYRSSSGKVDVSAETAGTLERAGELEKEIQDLEMQRSEMGQRFMETHPSMVSLQRKMKQLKAEQGTIDTRIKRLPEAELKSARLTRDVQVAHQLYMVLLNKAQELRVVKSGTIGNVRILDQAVVNDVPVGPKRGQIMGLGTSVGIILGVGIAISRKKLRSGVEDPELVEQVTGLPVYGSVPYSGLQSDWSRSRRKKGQPALILAADAPNEMAVESLRSLRTSLQFSLTEATNSIIAITGSRPGIGKSFVAMNLAHVLAETGRRVLLVDGDLRKGTLHRYFGTEPSPGLSEVIAGALPFTEAVRLSLVSKVQLLPRGRVPPNPAELLAGEHFRRLVEEFASRYDLVLIDSPPVLAVTDAALIGRTAGINMVVMRAGYHAVREITQTVKTLSQNGVRVNGFILNGVNPSIGSYTGVYHYEYK